MLKKGSELYKVGLKICADPGVVLGGGEGGKIVPEFEFDDGSYVKPFF
jgi:hypothetical protein